MGLQVLTQHLLPFLQTGMALEISKSIGMEHCDKDCEKPFLKQIIPSLPKSFVLLCIPVFILWVPSERDNFEVVISILILTAGSIIIWFISSQKKGAPMVHWGSILWSRQARRTHLAQGVAFGND